MGDTMTSYDPTSPRARDDASASSKLGWYHGLCTSVVHCMTICADYYEAAALFEELSRLSDAELARRGLDRPNLARDILAACERKPFRSRE